jgi:protein-disulfide isomerase
MHTAIAAPSRIPAGANDAGDGIVVGTGSVLVDTYIDFQCPFCRMFEEQSGPELWAMAAEGDISLVKHPVAFLDRLSTTAYSSRAAAASACAADGGRFPELVVALYANQPPEGGAGLSDEQLVELGAAVGLTDPGFARCVASHAYLPWAGYVTERATERGVHGIPTVFVAGRPVPAHARAITAAVAAASGS